MKTTILKAGAAQSTPASPSPILSSPAFSSGWALVSLALAVLLSSLGASVAAVALPTLAGAFGAAFQDVQWVIIAYLLAITTLVISIGRLGDMVGRRRLLLAGMLVFIGASVLCGAAPTLWLLIAARMAQGAGAAAMMTLAMAFIGDVIPKAKTGGAIGMLGTMSALGTALGPSLGGALIAAAGWPAIFLVNAPLGALAFFLARRHLPADRPVAKAADRPGFDVAGALLLALTLAAYALAMTIGRGDFGWFNITLLSAAVVGVCLFALVETKVAAPLIRLAMLRAPALWASLAASALVSTVMMATLVVGPFYLTQGLGLDAVAVGIVLSIGPVISALSGVPAGRIVDRLGAPLMVVIGLVDMAAGAIALAVLPGMFGIVGYVIAIGVLTPGYALFQTANNTGVMRNVASDQRGVVSGMVNLARNLGLISGASLMGAVFALASGAGGASGAGASGAGGGANPPAQGVADGMSATFMVATLLIVIALAVTIISGRAGEYPARPRQP